MDLCCYVEIEVLDVKDKPADTVNHSVPESSRSTSNANSSKSKTVFGCKICQMVVQVIKGSLFTVISGLLDLLLLICIGIFIVRGNSTDV
jgi:hypothetical protein